MVCLDSCNLADTRRLELFSSSYSVARFLQGGFILEEKATWRFRSPLQQLENSYKQIERPDGITSTSLRISMCVT